MKILYFAPLAFDDLKQRPQEIAEQLAMRHEVWYIEPTISYVGAKKNKHLNYYTSMKDISSTLHIWKLDGRFALPIRLQLLDPLHINTFSERKQLSQLLQKCDIIWVGYEVWERLLPVKMNGLLVYDKMDDNATLCCNPIIKRFLRSSEKKLLKRSNLVFVTANKFFDELKNKYKVYLIPNAFCYHEPISSHTVKRNCKKVFGYVGKISHWFDFEALRRLAIENSECDIVLVGPYDVPLLHLPNIKYIGLVPKSDIADWICSFDVCLYLFKQDELLDTINPVKLYEYLAYNKPVLAVNSREIQVFKELVTIYHNLDELVVLSHKIISTPFKNDQEKEAFLKRNSWKSRAKEIEEILIEIKESLNEKSHASLRNPS